MALTYLTGVEIKKGDRVLFHGERGEIEFVADPAIADPETDWYVHEYGRGVMILEPKNLGRAFLTEPQTAEDLEFIARRS